MDASYEKTMSLMKWNELAVSPAVPSSFQSLLAPIAVVGWGFDVIFFFFCMSGLKLVAHAWH